MSTIIFVAQQIGYPPEGGGGEEGIPLQIPLFVKQVYSATKNGTIVKVNTLLEAYQCVLSFLDI